LPELASVPPAQRHFLFLFFSFPSRPSIESPGRETEMNHALYANATLFAKVCAVKRGAVTYVTQTSIPRFEEENRASKCRKFYGTTRK
jgi:hypothetical protein